MALTTTVAGASSDSYATVLEADSYVSWRQGSAWDDASTADKEGVLKAAVAVLDELAYADRKSATTQALRFPTVRMTDSAGDYYIPERVKRAQSYMAWHLLEDPDLLAGMKGVRQISVPGGFSVTMDGSADGIAIPNDVLQLIDRYLFRSGPSYRDWDGPSRNWV